MVEGGNIRSMPPGFPDALRRTGKRFLKEYHSQMRPFENEYEVAPGVLVARTGGHRNAREALGFSHREESAPSLMVI